jgi:hypothetical protein
MKFRRIPTREVRLPLDAGFTARRRGIVSSIAAGIQMAVFCLATGMAAEQAAEVLTDRQGRTLDVIVLAVDGNQVRVRRQSDGREFSIPTDTLSDASREKLRNFKNPEPPGSVPQEVAAKPPVELSIPDQVLSHFTGKWQSAKLGLPDVNVTASVFSSQHVTMLIALENELVMAASPKDPASPIDWPDWVAEDARSEVEEVRQGIRDAQRKRIFAAAGQEAVPPALGKMRKADAGRLDDLYDRASKSWEAQRNKANKALAREKKSSRPKADAIKALEEEAKNATEAIASLHKAVYGFGVGEWLCQDPGWPEDHPAEILRKEISALRVAIHDRLVKAADHAGEEEYRSAEVDGISIYSSNFGVILDVSGSMTPHIEPLKEEIGKSFQSPLYREVNGCSLYMRQASRAAMPGGALTDTLSCIEEMILIYKVDTIYWFCDLNDPRDEAALRRLGDLLRMGDVRFYVRSMGRKPDRDLEALMEDF